MTALRLTQLDPHFVRYEQRGKQKLIIDVPAIAEAQGIRFLCPKCFAANSGPKGTHQVICWSRARGVPDEARPGPGRWTIDGDGFGNLTLNGDPPGGARSVQLNGGCDWHGFVTNGEVT